MDLITFSPNPVLRKSMPCSQRERFFKLKKNAATTQKVREAARLPWKEKSCTKTMTNPKVTTVSAKFTGKGCSEVIQVEWTASWAIIPLPRQEGLSLAISSWKRIHWKDVGLLPINTKATEPDAENGWHRGVRQLKNIAEFTTLKQSG